MDVFDLKEIDELLDLYDVTHRSVTRARRAKLTATQLAEVVRREHLMEVIAAEILRHYGASATRRFGHDIRLD